MRALLTGRAKSIIRVPESRGDVAYVWHAGVHAVEVALSLVAAEFQIRSQIVWAKQRNSIPPCSDMAFALFCTFFSILSPPGLGEIQRFTMQLLDWAVAVFWHCTQLLEDLVIFRKRLKEPTGEAF